MANLTNLTSRLTSKLLLNKLKQISRPEFSCSNYEGNSGLFSNIMGIVDKKTFLCQANTTDLP